MRGFCLFFVFSLFACASLGQKPGPAERRVSKELADEGQANPRETVDPFKPLPPSFFPDKDLEEDIIHGLYYPPNPRARAELIEKLLTNEINQRREPSLKEGETLEEALKNRYADVGKERFAYSSRYFCYNEKKDKEPIYNRNLRVRLYDKEGNVLTEDFVRKDGSAEPKFQDIIIYLPRHPDGWTARLARLEKRKEIAVAELGYGSQENIEEISYLNHDFRRSIWLVYDEEAQCHEAPGAK